MIVEVNSKGWLIRIEVCRAPPLLCPLQQTTDIQLIYEPTNGMSDHDYTDCTFIVPNATTLTQKVAFASVT